jgi:hypothetical protein
MSDTTIDDKAIDQSLERLIESNKLWAYRMTLAGEAIALDSVTHRQLIEADPLREDIAYEIAPTQH